MGEQIEPMWRNRERALEIQRRNKEKRALEVRNQGDGTSLSSLSSKRQKYYEGNVEGEVELGEFEVGATELVSKKEAKEMYCLPDGTLAVCAVVEKDNPHHKN